MNQREEDEDVKHIYLWRNFMYTYIKKILLDHYNYNHWRKKVFASIHPKKII